MACASALHAEPLPEAPRGPVCDRKFVSTVEDRLVEKEIIVRCCPLSTLPYPTMLLWGLTALAAPWPHFIAHVWSASVLCLQPSLSAQHRLPMRG